MEENQKGERGYPVAQMVESACSAGEPASIPGSGRSPGEGNGYPLQYSGLKNSMDRGAWRATIHYTTEGVTLSHIFSFAFHTSVRGTISQHHLQGALLCPQASSWVWSVKGRSRIWEETEVELLTPSCQLPPTGPGLCFSPESHNFHGATLS